MNPAINCLQVSLDKVDYLYDTLKSFDLDTKGDEFVYLSTGDAEKLLDFPYQLSLIGLNVCRVRDCLIRLEENNERLRNDWK